jgi:hypothetical protein
VPRRYKRKRKRFPKFFEDALGPMLTVEVPGELTADENEALDPDGRFANDPLPIDAPLWALRPDDEPSGFVTEIDVPFPNEVLRDAGGNEGPAPSGTFSEEESAGADALAHYKPWHVWGADWGIYFFEEAFRDFAASTAQLAGVVYADVEPFVMRQILEHELTHFEFEVIGTKLEAICSTPLYRSYLVRRYSRPTRWTGAPWARGHQPGPTEEALATWREVHYSRRKKPKPPAGYQAAASKLADASPPGYNAWRCGDTGNPHLANLVSASVCSLILDAPVVAPLTHELSDVDFGDVPVYWRGNPALIPASAPAKDFTRPSPKRLVAWLRTNKAEIHRGRGKGSHMRFEWRGRSGGFPTSRDPVPKRPCEEIAAIFGFETPRDLYLAISANRVVT